MPYIKPDRTVEIDLPDGSSEKFISELLAALPDDGFKSSYLKEEILTKYVDKDTTPAAVRRDRAVTKWLQVERQNSRTNQRLYYNDVDLGWIESDALIGHIRSLIERILGPVRYPDVLYSGTHTNGASTRVRRSPKAAIMKLTGMAELSDTAIAHWLAFSSGTCLSSQTLSLNESSTMFTVPKKSDIDRVACKEPEINMLLQRSVGNHIRRALRKVGVDLNDQRVNQQLARVAVSQKLATIDLKSASDTITRQLIIQLLPFEWWSLLDDLRCKTCTIDRDIHENEMFSAMGNGFTFELESLLFYAITRVVCWKSGIKGRISVYGDDIIAPVACVNRLQRVFSYFGFEMNRKKTHSSGNFRESCGKHYHKGFDVTPFYIRREVTTLPDLMNLLNQVLEWDGRGWGFFLTPSLASFHRKWSALVPKPFWGGWDTSDPSVLVTDGQPSLRLTPQTRKLKFPQDKGLSSWLLTREQMGGLPLHLDPRIQVGWKATPVISLERRTTWTPYLIQGSN